MSKKWVELRHFCVPTMGDKSKSRRGTREAHLSPEERPANLAGGAGATSQELRTSTAGAGWPTHRGGLADAWPTFHSGLVLGTNQAESSGVNGPVLLELAREKYADPSEKQAIPANPPRVAVRFLSTRRLRLVRT